MPACRFTVRQLVGVVAVSALAMAASDWHVRMKWLTIEYEMRALAHARAGFAPAPPPPHPISGVERWEAEMAAKWSWAARYPWLPVEPDTPRPE